MASIKCGQCKGTHGSVAEVRVCYAGWHTEPKTEKTGLFAPTPAQVDQQASAYMHNVRLQAGRDAYGRAATTDHPEGVVATLRELRAEVKANMQEVFPTVHSLRVAVRVLGEGDKVRFFQINVPTRGNWAGKVFLKEQAGDDFHPVKSMDRQVRILREVGRDLMAAVELYGREIGCCGMCHRTLTDEESRARGIGPVCLDKIGA